MSITTLPNYEKNLALYLDFAFTRTRTRADIASDFDRLLANPQLVSLGFWEEDPSIMLLETPVIDILSKGIWYRLGSYIIMLRRVPEKGEGPWASQFRIVRAQGLYKCEDRENLYHHPHICNSKEDDIFGTNVGLPCINRGKQMLHEMVSRGRIADVYPLFLEMLRTYPTGHPYLDAEHWPLAPQNQEDLTNA